MGKRIIEIPVEPGDVVYAIMGDRIMAVPVEMVYVNRTAKPERQFGVTFISQTHFTLMDVVQRNPSVCP